MSENSKAYNFSASKKPLTNESIVFSSNKKVNTFNKKVVEVNKKGIVAGSRENQDVTFSLDVNEELNILFSDFRSDCSEVPFIFDGFIPVFLEKANASKSDNVIGSGDILVNGISGGSLTFVYGNRYRIMVPNTFGNMYVEKENSHIYFQLLNSSEKYREYELISKAESFVYFSIKFDRLPLVNFQCNILFDKSAPVKNAGIKHPLSFYNYELANERWLFSSPNKIIIEKIQKSQYNYYYNGGDKFSYYVNGFENPILIFDYDTVYKIENRNKMSNPFYFDAKSEGMFKYPYNDFENDINTDRIYLNILFPSDEKRNSLEIDPFILTRGNVGELGVLDYWEDPYEELPAFKERYPVYDPDNIFYCSSKNSYFGNRVLIGKRFIQEIIGKYGISSPDVKKISFKQNGSYFVYDVFNHVSGKFIFINCLNFNDIVFDKDSAVSQKFVDQQTRSHISKNSNFTNLYFVPDIFSNYEHIVNEITGVMRNNFSYSQGPVSILIPFSIADLESKDSVNMYQFYLASSKQVDSEIVRNKFQVDFLNLIKKVVDRIKEKNIFEVTVEYV